MLSTQPAESYIASFNSKNGGNNSGSAHRSRRGANLLGLGKWTEEQYFPALIIKGAYARHCLYCALSTQTFDAYCDETLYTYLSADAFVEFLERSRSWRGVNIFGDFAALDIDGLLQRMEGRHYAIEITIGDIFAEIEIGKLMRFAAHFARVWLGFRTLPRGCYLAVQPITWDMIDTDYNRRLLSWAQRDPKVAIGIWVNRGNLAQQTHFGAYSRHFFDLDSWLRYPTQLPTESSFARLTERTINLERAIVAARRVYVACRIPPEVSPQTFLQVAHDPFTIIEDAENQRVRVVEKFQRL